MGDGNSGEKNHSVKTNLFPKNFPKAASNNLFWSIFLLERMVGMENLKIRTNPGLTFVKREVESIVEKDINQSKSYEISSNIYGLDGVTGPIPHWLNLIIANEDKDYAPLGDFLNIFSHRFIQYLYEAWIKNQPFLSFQRKNSDIATILFSLSGANHHNKNQLSMSSFSYIGNIGHKYGSANSLEILLNNYYEHLNIKFKIKEFVKRKLSLSKDERSRLGKNILLKNNFILGKHVFDISGSFRIIMGPMNYKEYLEFLPNGQHHNNFVNLIESYISPLLSWDVAFIIEAKSIINKENKPLLKKIKKDEKQEFNLNKQKFLCLGNNMWLFSKNTSNKIIIKQLNNKNAKSE